MHVSIIIVNYNTNNLLNNCIKSIIKNTHGIDYEIIVIDNDSQDESIELAKNNHPYVKYLLNNENIGFAAANNIAVKKAQGKYLLFLNPDTLIVNNAIKILYEYMAQYKNVGVCGGILLDENKNPTYSYGDFPTLREVIYNAFLLRKFFPRHWFPSSGKIPRKNLTDAIEVDYIVGADLFTTKELFQNINGFDETFFAYFEETDFCYNIKNKINKKVVLIPEAKIIHLQGKSFNNDRHKIKLFMESEIKYFKKRNIFYAIIVLFIHFISSSLLFILYRIFKKDKSYYFKNKLYAVYSILFNKILYLR